MRGYEVLDAVTAVILFGLHANGDSEQVLEGSSMAGFLARASDTAVYQAAAESAACLVVRMVRSGYLVTAGRSSLLSGLELDKIASSASASSSWGTSVRSAGAPAECAGCSDSSSCSPSPRGSSCFPGAQGTPGGKALWRWALDEAIAVGAAAGGSISSSSELRASRPDGLDAMTLAQIGSAG